MKKLRIGVLFVIAITSLIAHARSAAVPMAGDGVGVITSFTPGTGGVQITAIGEGEATHLGKFTREEALLLDPANGTFTGSITFTAADGSQLTCTVAGGFTGANTAAGTYTFTGGTKRFEGAAGVAYFSVVQSDPANFTFGFTGTIDAYYGSLHQ